MKIYGLEKLSLVDYDGKVACTVFTGKCNFKCGFCHNSALVLDYDTLPPLDEKEFFDYLVKRKNLLEGVCITGGEPTLQKDLPKFCEQIKKLGYNVKVDTNGTNPDMVKLLRQNGLCDYFAMDVKNDRENYAEIIGFDKFDTLKIEKTVEYFLTNDIDYEFRTTLIDEYHKKENIENIGKWIRSAKSYVMQRFKSSDTCISKTLREVPTDTAKEYRDIMEKYVQKVSLRGYDL